MRSGNMQNTPLQMSAGDVGPAGRVRDALTASLAIVATAARAASSLHAAPDQAAMLAWITRSRRFAMAVTIADRTSHPGAGLKSRAWNLELVTSHPRCGGPVGSHGSSRSTVTSRCSLPSTPISPRAVRPPTAGGDLPRKYFHTYDLFVALTAAAEATSRSGSGAGSVSSLSVIRSPPPRRSPGSTTSPGDASSSGSAGAGTVRRCR